MAQSPKLPASGPYPASHANFLYHAMFCDDPAAFAPQDGAEVAAESWQAVLYSSPQPDPNAVEQLARDSSAESRVRMLAFNWLRKNGRSLAVKELLGVIIEVSLREGLDALAVYADGRIRYINHSGGIVVFEGAPKRVADQVPRVLQAAEAVVAKIGPWDRPRLPHPQEGLLRLTFLVSDGLYFGEGPISTMEHDPLARPLVAELGRMQERVVEAALDNQDDAPRNQPNGEVP